MNAIEAMTALNAEVVVCQLCGLHKGRQNAVPGEGPVPSKIMFIGEGPGATEDKTGRPFVGRAGKLLADSLASIGYRREDVFIANVVKCRPPENRDPSPDEILACKPYLDRQIELLNPAVICTLGRFSMARWFQDARITKIHGQPKRVGNRLIVPMFHPAAALRQPSFMDGFRADFARLPEWVAQAEAWQAEAAAPEPESAPSPPANDEDDHTEQLSLF